VSPEEGRPASGAPSECRIALFGSDALPWRSGAVGHLPVASISALVTQTVRPVLFRSKAVVVSPCTGLTTTDLGGMSMSSRHRHAAPHED
jgi:hypothetical protein